jgi:hypothetical protein
MRGVFVVTEGEDTVSWACETLCRPWHVSWFLCGPSVVTDSWEYVEKLEAEDRREKLEIKEDRCELEREIAVAPSAKPV